MRVTNHIISNSIIHTLNRQKSQMQVQENNISSGTRIHKPSDDPIGSSQQIFLNSRVRELEQYNRNIVEAKSSLQIVDSQLNSVTEIMQKIRVLSIQAANGINTEFERKEVIAKEVNQLLHALVDIGNIKDGTGRAVFGGSIIERNPFQPIYSDDNGNINREERYITGINYVGDIQVQNREIERGEIMQVSLAGSQVFGGTNTFISSTTDAGNYIATGEQSFAIDGHNFLISPGDNLNDIVRKINNANIQVQADIGSNNEMILTSTTPHKIWLEDLKGSTLLQDIGLVDSANPNPPNNISASALVSGLSLFDVVIQLRDDLIQNNIESIGGRDLANIDSALENILSVRGEIGSRTSRLELHEKRLLWDRTYLKELAATNEGTDIPEAVMHLKILENAHEYALRIGSKIIRPTLVDFLR